MSQTAPLMRRVALGMLVACATLGFGACDAGVASPSNPRDVTYRTPGATMATVKTTPAPSGAPAAERVSASIARLLEYVDGILALKSDRLPAAADPYWAGILATIASDSSWLPVSGLSDRQASVYRALLEGLSTTYAAIRSMATDTDRASAMPALLRAQRERLEAALAASVGAATSSPTLNPTVPPTSTPAASPTTAPAATTASTATPTTASTVPPDRRYADTDPAVSYAGTWGSAASTAYAGGSVAWATSAGASATLRFTGRRITWFGPVGPTRGSATVYLDGSPSGVVTQYAAIFSARQAVFSHDFGVAGAHEIRIVVAGTSGHPMVAIDELVAEY